MHYVHTSQCPVWSRLYTQIRCLLGVLYVSLHDATMQLRQVADKFKSSLFSPSGPEGRNFQLTPRKHSCS
jgi:hypothetical protein